MGTEALGGRTKKLVTGVSLALLAPEWNRSCAECERHVYRDDGTPQLRGGLLVLRPAGTPTPCHKCPKVPADLRASGADWKACRAAAVDPTPQTRRALAFYRRCRAVGRFPDDPLVAECAAAIADVERAVESAGRERLTRAVEVLNVLLTKRRS